MSVDRIIQAESGGDPYARNPRSSATGAGQFIDSTWLSMVGKYRPDLVEGKSKSEILALRTDPALSKAMTEAYAAENSGVLSGAGFETTPGNTYLAHFAGPQGALKVLGADPAAPAGAILGPAVVKANPFLANMTAGDLVAWANKKMGGGRSANAGGHAAHHAGSCACSATAGSHPATSAWFAERCRPAAALRFSFTRAAVCVARATNTEAATQTADRSLETPRNAPPLRRGFFMR